MARIVTETVTLTISKLVKDDADDQESWLTSEEIGLIGAVVDQLDEEMTTAVVELATDEDDIKEEE